MDRYQVFYTESAKADIQGLEKKTAQRILKKVLFYSSQNNPLSFAKPLNNVSAGRFRFRVGEYRIIFRIEHNGTIHILMILRVGHRKDIYGF